MHEFDETLFICHLMIQHDSRFSMISDHIYIYIYIYVIIRVRDRREIEKVPPPYPRAAEGGFGCGDGGPRGPCANNANN